MRSNTVRMESSSAEFLARQCLMWLGIGLLVVAGANAAETADSVQRIDEALEEAVTPLDDVAFSIEQGEYQGTEEFLGHYISAMERAHHRFHPDLVRPLTLLGDAQLGQLQIDKALASYGRALHIRRVNDGLFAPQQVELVYRQADALKAVGNLEEAGHREEYAYSVLSRAHGPLSEDLLAGTYRLATWYRETYNIFAARALYERAMNIHEANGNQASLSALPALKGLVFTYRQERFPPHYVSSRSSSAFGSGPMPSSSRATIYSEQITINNFPAAERALQRIVLIRREDPQSTPLEVFEAILDLADWHLMWEHFRKAHTLYEFVYGQMDEIDSIDAAEYFAEPKLLHMPLPADPKAPRTDESGPEGGMRTTLTGFIEATFRVSANGGPQDVEIVASEPEGLMDFRSRRSIREARYRPAMENGRPSPTPTNPGAMNFPICPRRARRKSCKRRSRRRNKMKPSRVPRSYSHDQCSPYRVRFFLAWLFTWNKSPALGSEFAYGVVPSALASRCPGFPTPGKSTMTRPGNPPNGNAG